MASQRPVIIPPYARLDPEMCSEFGAPILAWHPFSGRVSVAGGGIGYSRGRGRDSGLFGTGTTLVNGGALIGSSNNDGCNLGSDISLRPVNFTLWTYCRPSNFTSLYGVVGNFNATTNKGIGIEINASTGALIIRASAGAVKRYISSNSGTSQTLETYMASVVGGVSWDGVYRNGKKSTGNTGDATPASPTYDTNFFLGSRGDGTASFQGRLYGVLLWAKAQPQALAVDLDEDPDLMWWWPGKTRVYISIPGAAGGISVSITASTPNINIATITPVLSIGSSLTIPSEDILVGQGLGGITLSIGSILTSVTPNINLNTGVPTLGSGLNIISTTPNILLNTGVSILSIGSNLTSTTPNINLGTGVSVLSIGNNLVSTVPNINLNTYSPDIFVGGNISITSTTPDILINTGIASLSIGSNITSTVSDILVGTVPAILSISLELISTTPDILLSTYAPSLATGTLAVVLLYVPGNIVNLIPTVGGNVTTVGTQERETDTFAGSRMVDKYTGTRL